MGLIVPYHQVSMAAGRKHKILATYAVPNSNSLQIRLERTRTAIHANIALALSGSSQTAASPHLAARAKDRPMERFRSPAMRSHSAPGFSGAAAR